MDWTDCEIVESVPGKVSGAPVLVGTRIPADAITENVDAFIEIDGMSLDQAIAATADCFPSAGIVQISALLSYRSTHDLQPQP
jgi:uncharacterized protein (DUF433 family)